MEIIIPILVIAGALIIFYATRFLSKGFKVLTKATLFLIIMLFILTIIFFKDITDMRNDLQQEKNTFILRDDDRVITAVTLMPSQNGTFGLDSFEYFTENQIAEIEDNIKDKNYRILGSKRTFIIEKELLRRNYSLTLGADLNQDEMLEIMQTDAVYDLVATKLEPQYNLSMEHLKLLLRDTYGPPEQIKGYLFAALLINYFQDKDSDFLRSIKSGKLEIRPQKASFKIMASLPLL